MVILLLTNYLFILVIAVLVLDQTVVMRSSPVLTLDLD